ncbi:hypothetical protein V9T40_007204 [Parthenolecanium corni]|uniref:YqaJ viral recombinase domain-containing protein n=1 Tax=Parthenolecanium corni TaxID=536013 RepID=A0AAN9Y909_9HEMI
MKYLLTHNNIPFFAGVIDNRSRKRKPGKLILSAHRKKRKSFPPRSLWKVKSRESAVENDNVDYTIEDRVSESDNFTTLPESSFRTPPIEQSNTDVQSVELSNLIIEKENPEFSPSPINQLSGRRIVDFPYLLEQIYTLDAHNMQFACRFSNLKFQHEKSRGLAYEWNFKCDMCNQHFQLYSDRNIDRGSPKEQISHMPVLTAAIGGVVASGNGQAVLDCILSAMEIPTISSATYTKVSNKVNDIFIEAAVKEMIEAGKEEAELAIRAGDVGKDGVPNVKVTADGCWARRSFGRNYASLGGTGVIVGLRTQKVLFMCILNKYCYKCSRRESQKTDFTNSSVPVTDHVCFKNYEGASSNMEQVALVEGFCCSMQMHGVRYSHMVADGDSNVFKKILEANPYGNDFKIQKVACKNHVLRCFRNNLEDYCSSSSNRYHPLIAAKKTLSKAKERMANAIDSACRYRGTENAENAVQLLKNDIMNVSNHIFGDHAKCADYFFDKKNESSQNRIPELQETDAFNKLRELLLRVANQSDTLIFNQTNNYVESFNAVICKTIAGKRVNYTGGNGYHGRGSLALLSYNRKQPLKILHKKVCNKSPSCVISRKHDLRLLRRRNYNKTNKKAKKRLRFERNEKNDSYGLSKNPDLEPEIYAAKREEFMSKMALSAEEREHLEESTRGQAATTLWKEERRKRITASIFGNVCKMKENTSSARMVENIVAPNFRGTYSTSYGNRMEPLAKAKFEAEKNITLENCGLLIHPNYPFLGASPDGLISNNQVLEIKCPSTLSENTMDEVRAKFEDGKIRCLDRNGVLISNDNYFYQIQGQLEISNRESAIFLMYGPHFMYCQEVKRDKDFWSQNMLPKLKKFYENCLLPELIDSRLERQRPVRNVNFEGVEVDPNVKKKKTATTKKRDLNKKPNIENRSDILDN